MNGSTNRHAPVKLYVVEDESVIAMDIEARLTALGYDLLGSADCAAVALPALARLRPDIVLMDIGIKGDMDGVSLASRIRDQFDLPSIFLTAFSDDESIARAMVANPLGFLSKPFSDREVRAAIEIGLYREAQTREVRRQRDELARLNEELTRTRGELSTLRRLLPMCSWCKSIRNDDGYWQTLHDYIGAQTGLAVTDGICDACAHTRFGVGATP